jgi:carboxyl-terminal processing protease
MKTTQLIAVFAGALLLLAGPVARAGETAAGNGAALEAKPEYEQIARRFARHFPRHHLTRSTLDDTISAQAWTNFFSSLDFERVYFLQSDLDRFSADLHNLDDQLREGDLTLAFQVYEVFRDRVADRAAFVEGMLARGFDLDLDESYHWKRKDQPWPRDKAEWDDLWRRKIKNEYVRMLVARELGEDEEDAAGEDEEAEAPPPGDAPSPEETIAKRYQQVRSVMQDNDAEWVLEKYLSAFAHAYDPHSGYMSPSSVEDFDIEMRLSLVGIGALLRSEDGAAKIVRLIPGGPADRDKREKRLMPGDKIIAVGQGDGELVDILHWPLYKVVKLIRGPKGSKVVLRIIPASDPTGTTTKKVDLVRDEVKLEEQAASHELREIPDEDGVTRRLGVIKLPAFYANLSVKSVDAPGFRSAAYDVQKALETLMAEDVDGVLLDLRNNGGGSLLEAIRMIGLFIRTGPTVQVRERFAIRVLPDNDPTLVYEGSLAVLVNRLSASASEIVAGALQDYGRAVIIGDSKTHGKGTVQSIVPVGREPDLGSLKITTASYYRINGGSTQLRGITPDIVVPSVYDRMELGEDYLPNAIDWSRVAATAYSLVGELEALIPELRRRSEQRRAGDERFAAYAKLLSRIEEMSRDADVPLNIVERRKLARAEKELNDMQRRLAPDVEGDENGAKDTDLILDEGLHVLADFVALQNASPRTEAVAAQQSDEEQRTWADFLSDWLKGEL